MNQVHPTTQYALDVLNTDYGRWCCIWEHLACQRHLKDLERQGTNEFPYVFDETRANRIIDWYQKMCRHVRGPYSGQPIMLEPWQIFDKGCLYGWVHKDTGARRFKLSFQIRARGNVKSTENSADCLYSMCADALYPPGCPELVQYDMSPEVACAAVDKLQARRVWDDARNMALASPAILKRLSVKKNSISHKTRNGLMIPLSKDTKNKDSGAQTYISVDEYHEWPSSQIKDTLFSGFGKRYQQLMSIISTAGLNAENNPCRNEQKIAEKILKGDITDESYFAMIRTLDEKDDPHDPENWPKANPILRNDGDYSRLLKAQIKQEHDLAFASGDYEKIRTWLCKRVDVWQDAAENKYLSACMDQFKESAVSRKEFLQLTHGLDVFVGIDLSKKIDLTAAGYVIPLPDGRYAITGYGFIPQDAVTRHEHTDRVPYQAWAKDGWCKITPGSVTDYMYIQQHIEKVEKNNKWVIQELCYDPYQATYFAQEQERAGRSCVEVRQGVATLSEPTKLFRELVMQGKIVHDNSPLVIWCFSNAVEEIDSNGNIKLSKKTKDDSQRIDVAAAIINAFVRAITYEFGTGLFYSPNI